MTTSIGWVLKISISTVGRFKNYPVALEVTCLMTLIVLKVRKYVPASTPVFLKYGGFTRLQAVLRTIDMLFLTRGITSNPVGASTDNYLYLQESGFDDGSTSPVSAVTSYIESSQMDIGDGDHFVFLKRLIPDITFADSTATSPSANFTLEARNFPGENYTNSDTNPVVRSATVPVEQFTNVVNLRLRGRSFALKVESLNTGVGWRLGSPRVDMKQDGRR